MKFCCTCFRCALNLHKAFYYEKFIYIVSRPCSDRLESLLLHQEVHYSSSFDFPGSLSLFICTCCVLGEHSIYVDMQGYPGTLISVMFPLMCRAIPIRLHIMHAWFLSSLDIDDLFVICFLPVLGANVYWTKAAFFLVLKTLIQDGAILASLHKVCLGKIWSYRSCKKVIVS